MSEFRTHHSQLSLASLLQICVCPIRSRYRAARDWIVSVRRCHLGSCTMYSPRVRIALVCFELGRPISPHAHCLLSSITSHPCPPASHPFRPPQDPERWLSLVVLGALVFIPGSYHLVIAYRAWRGDAGYSFADIPSGFVENLDDAVVFDGAAADDDNDN